MYRKKLKKPCIFDNDVILLIASSKEEQAVGVYYDEGPPVPIPNTEVKLIGAEDTWWVTAWEDRLMPTQLKRPPNRAVVLLYRVYRGACIDAGKNRLGGR